MFLLVAVDFLLAEAPELSVIGLDEVGAIARAFDADNDLADFALAAVHLAALAKHARAVGVCELNGEVIVNVALLRTGPGLASAQRQGFDRVILESPVDDVEIVNVLLDNVVAGKPGEVVPVSELPFHVTPALLAVNNPDRPAIPVGPAVNELADRAVVKAFNGFIIPAQMTALGAGHNAQALLPGEFTCFEDPSH